MPETAGTNKDSTPGTPETTDTGEGSSQQACSTGGMKIGGMCFNWKVIAGLVVLGLGIWIVAPNLVVAAAPLLLFAACPLSMWFMMRGMSGGHNAPGADSSPASRNVAEPARPRDLAELKAQHSRLSAELEALESDVAQAENGSPDGSKEVPTATNTSPDARGGDVI